jgi:hypothetical protein
VTADERALGELAAQFRDWRDRTQPASYDDIARVDRPAGWLADWSGDAVVARRRALAGFGRRYHALDLATAPVAVRVDRRLVGSALARAHWELDLQADWRRNPCFYLDQSLLPVYELLLPPPPFGAGRAAAIAAHLANVPDLLGQARENLAGTAAAPFARHAIPLLATAAGALDAAMAALEPHLPEPQRTFFPGRTAKAVDALHGYADWLTARLPACTGPAHAGERAFGFFLHRVALLPYSVSEIRELGRLEYHRACATASALRGRCHGRPPAPLFPDRAHQIDRQQHDEDAVRDFLAHHGLIRLPGDVRRYRNAPMPAYLAPLAWLGVPHHPGAADDPADDAVRYLPEPGPELPYFQLAEARDPRVGIAHEGVHAWQLALSRQHPDPIRRHYYDSVPNEGLAHTTEELLLLAGLFDDAPESGLFIADTMRLRARRVEVDVALALGHRTPDEAAGDLATAIPVDRATASGEALFFAGHPGQGLSYQIGKLQLFDLLASCARGAKFDPAAFHGRLWREGNVPFVLQRWELLGLTDQLDAATRLGGGDGPPAE